ncbi:MAG: efflux RND transporter periplasmic adaptor subunit [Gammaproteobacteria bacterium]|nr:efflux RND transporter periplasmic adaptor subunit [Gammaproteobacteria bacterium]
MLTRDLTRAIRAVGRVTYGETRLADVALKFDAWIGELHVDYVGAPVEKGQKLFTVNGPELLAAQQEYLELGDRPLVFEDLGAGRRARHHQRRGHGGPGAGHAARSG